MRFSASSCNAVAFLSLSLLCLCFAWQRGAPIRFAFALQSVAFAKRYEALRCFVPLFIAVAPPLRELPRLSEALLCFAVAPICRALLGFAGRCFAFAFRFSPLRTCAFAATYIAVAVRTGAMPLLCFPVAGFAFAPRVCSVRFIAMALHYPDLACLC